MSDRRSSRIFLVRTTASVCAAVFFFLILEVFSRIALAVYTKDPGALTRFNAISSIKEYRLRLIPYLSGREMYYKGTPCFTYKDEGGNTITYNSKGYRTKEFADTKSSVRIACFGGSSTFGTGCDDDQTWPYRLQCGLDEAAPGKYEVINAGFGSYNTALISNLFKNEFFRYKPDIVIFYCGYNEHTGGAVRLFGNSSKMRIFVRNIDLFLEYNSSLYFIMSRLLRKGMGFGIAAEGARITRAFKKNLGMIIDICSGSDIRCVIVKQPLYVKSESASGAASGALYSKYYEDPYFNEKTFRKIEVHVKDNRSSARYGKAYYYQSLLFEAIDDMKKENGEIVVLDHVNDMIAEQEKVGGLFIDIVHLSPVGNRRLAKNILDDGGFKKILRLYNK